MRRPRVTSATDTLNTGSPTALVQLPSFTPASQSTTKTRNTAREHATPSETSSRPTPRLRCARAALARASHSRRSTGLTAAPLRTSPCAGGTEESLGCDISTPTVSNQPQDVAQPGDLPPTGGDGPR